MASTRRDVAKRKGTRARVARTTRVRRPAGHTRAVTGARTQGKKDSVPLPMPATLLDATLTPDVVEVPARTVVAIDGAGSPGSEAFGRSVGALYTAAYGLKFARKKERGRTFKVGPMEGRWWAEGVPEDLGAPPPPESWRWRLRMGVPDDVTEAELREVLAAAERRRGTPAAGDPPPVRVERILAATLGRILHVGPYADEPRSFAAIDGVLRERGLCPARTHLEVYLSDPRRTAPARLRTALLREIAA